MNIVLFLLLITATTAITDKPDYDCLIDGFYPCRRTGNEGPTHSCNCINQYMRCLIDKKIDIDLKFKTEIIKDCIHYGCPAKNCPVTFPEIKNTTTIFLDSKIIMNMISVTLVLGVAGAFICF